MDDSAALTSFASTQYKTYTINFFLQEKYPSECTLFVGTLLKSGSNKVKHLWSYLIVFSYDSSTGHQKNPNGLQEMIFQVFAKKKSNEFRSGDLVGHFNGTILSIN